MHLHAHRSTFAARRIYRAPLSDTNETSFSYSNNRFVKTSDYFLTSPRDGRQFSKYIYQARALFMREKNERQRVDIFRRPDSVEFVKNACKIDYMASSINY